MTNASAVAHRPREEGHGQQYRRSYSGPLLVAVEPMAAELVGIELAELRAAVEQLAPVALRRSDGAKLYRVVEVMQLGDPARARRLP